MTAPSPEKIAEWREKFESKYTSQELFFQCGEYSDRYIQHEWQGYLRARTEQATEIAALKAKIKELMPLAKFGAVVLKTYKEGYVSDEEIGNFALRSGCLTQPSEGYAPDIEATIAKILKD
jgi:hypothetical protein